MADSWLNLGSLATRFEERPNWITPAKTSTTINSELLRYFPSAVDITELNINGSALAFEYGFENMKRKQAYTVLDFFGGRVGRLMRFWVPVWTNMFTLYANITNGDNNIKINSVLFSSTAITTYQRIFIYTKAGDSISRRCATVADGVGYEQLNLASNMDRDLTQGDIEIFSVLALARLDIDTLEMVHQSSDICSTVLRFVELVGEYNNVGI